MRRLYEEMDQQIKQEKELTLQTVSIDYDKTKQLASES